MPIQMIQAAIQAPALMPLLLTQCLCALMLLGALNARMTGEQRLEPGFQFILEDLLGPAMLEQVDVTARGSSFLAQGVALLARWPIIIVAIVKRSFVVVFTGSLCGAPASSGSCNQGWEVHAALVVIPLVFTALSALFPLRGGQQFAHGLASATGTLHGLGAAIRVVYLAALQITARVPLAGMLCSRWQDGSGRCLGPSRWLLLMLGKHAPFKYATFLGLMKVRWMRGLAKCCPAG